MNQDRPSSSSRSDSRHPTGPRRRRVRTWQLLVLWLFCMVPFLSWGLPTSRYDALLFGGSEPWDAERYDAARALQARRDRISGADTDLDPVESSDQLIDLTADEAARAAILLRYRLYTRQPDEMITFQALQRMNPRDRDLDPRLYQYGGGYIYLIGAALGVSSLLGLTTLTSDVGAYLAEPELFARFYVVARIVTLIFGALTLVATVRLARRAAGRAAGWIALTLVAASPVFITGVLEAKPHLPSACLLLWAILSALNYHTDGRRRDALLMGLQAGYAFGLVLTGLAGAFLWPVLLVTRRHDARRAWRDLALAAVLAAAVYVVTNPYIPYNLLFNRAALAGNVENSTAMYEIGRLTDGLVRVGELMLESCGPAILLGGLIALAWLFARHRRQVALAGVPGLALLALCVAIGAGKPAEFARFLLLPAILLAVGTAALLRALADRRLGWAVLATVLTLAVMRTPAYLHSFYVDAHFNHESRHAAAQFLSENTDADDTIGVVQVPAPYAIPPIDFATRRVVLLPRDEASPSGSDQIPPWLVFTADDAGVFADAWWQPHYRLVRRFAGEPFQLSRIAWANKPTFVYQRNE